MLTLCLNCRKQKPSHPHYRCFCSQSCYDEYTVAEEAASAAFARAAVDAAELHATEKELRMEIKSLRIALAQAQVEIERLR